MGNMFINCGRCGITYSAMSKACPNCGEGKPASHNGSGEIFFSFERSMLLDYIKLFVATLLYAGFFVVLGLRMNANAQLFRTALDTMNSQIAAYGETNPMGEHFFSELARCGRYVSYCGTATVIYTILAAAVVISGLLMIFRLRLSFRIMFFTAAAATVTAVITLIAQGIVFGKYGGLIPLIAIIISVAGAVTKKCYDVGNSLTTTTVLPELTDSEKPAEAGAPMPKVQEVYSFEDMFGDVNKPEAQSAAQADPQPQMQAVEAPAVSGYAPAKPSVVFPRPSDVGESIAEDGTDVAVTPLASTMYASDGSAASETAAVYRCPADVGRSIAEDGTNVAVTPLGSPMFDVDTMDDESMPSANVVESAAETAPVRAAVKERIWFCSCCGSLNENIDFCNFCGAENKD